MSRQTLQLALGGLVVCAIGGFWLGLQGALPRDGAGSASAEASSPLLEPAPNAYRTPLEAAPYSDIPVASDEPPASDAAPASDAEPPEAQTPPPPTTPRPAPPPRVEAAPRHRAARTGAHAGARQRHAAA